MDPSTKRTLTILGVVAVVLIALFVVSLIYNPDGGARNGCSTEKREKWRERLFGSKPIAQGQLSGCTTKLGTFTVNGSCELRIAASDERSRRLVIEVAAPMGMKRTTDADGRSIEMNAKLKPGKSEQISIGKKREAILLTCPGSTGCQVSIK